MSFVLVLLFGLIVILLVTNFSQLPRLFILFAGSMIGFEISKRLQNLIIDRQSKLLDEYRKILLKIKEAIEEADSKVKAQKKQSQKPSPKEK